MNATRRDLEIQFDRALRSGWLPWFQREAKRAGTTTAHLLGIGSRETNLKNIKGDFRNGRYNGFGVMQVDIGTDAAYARAWTPQNVEPSIVRGVDIYLTKVRDTKNTTGRRTQVRSRFFIGKQIDAEDLRRIATAAYNCGRWAYYHFSNGQNVDTTTTGDDYSRDVYDRAVEFADMLEERGYEQLAIHKELALQGKYARTGHREQWGFYGVPERVKLPVGEAHEAQEELAAVDYERESVENNPFVVTDDEIDLFDEKSGEAPTEQTGAAEPNGIDPGAPAPSSVEPGAGAEPGPELGAAPAPPAGDPPDANPSWFMSIEDWKPWAVRWATRIWKGVTTLSVPSIGGFSFAAVSSGPNWWIWLVVGVVVVLLILGFGILATLVVAGIWLFQNRKIPGIKQDIVNIAADPMKKNVGLTFVKK